MQKGTNNDAMAVVDAHVMPKDKAVSFVGSTAANYFGDHVDGLLANTPEEPSITPSLAPKADSLSSFMKDLVASHTGGDNPELDAFVHRAQALAGSEEMHGLTLLKRLLGHFSTDSAGALIWDQPEGMAVRQVESEGFEQQLQAVQDTKTRVG